MLVSDWSNNTWVTGFSDVAEQLLGESSETIGTALEHEKTRAEQIFGRLAFRSVVLKLRVKQEYYGDVLRSKTSAVAVVPLKYKERNAYVVKELQRMTGIERVAA